MSSKIKIGNKGNYLNGYNVFLGCCKMDIFLHCIFEPLVKNEWMKLVLSEKQRREEEKANFLGF